MVRRCGLISCSRATSYSYEGYDGRFSPCAQRKLHHSKRVTTPTTRFISRIVHQQLAGALLIETFRFSDAAVCGRKSATNALLVAYSQIVGYSEIATPPAPDGRRGSY